MSTSPAANCIRIGLQWQNVSQHLTYALKLSTVCRCGAFAGVTVTQRHYVNNVYVVFYQNLSRNTEITGINVFTPLGNLKYDCH